MKSSIRLRAVLLTILMALFLCVTFAENETASGNNTNATMPGNMTNITANATEILSSATNITMSQNATQSGNATNPFAKAKGSITAVPIDDGTGDIVIEDTGTGNTGTGNTGTDNCIDVGNGVSQCVHT